MKWIIIAWDQIRLNKKISIILVVFITMSIFLIGVISFYNNIFSYSQKQCEQVLTGTIDNIGLLYVENGDFYSQKAQDFIRLYKIKEYADYSFLLGKVFERYV